MIGPYSICSNLKTLLNERHLQKKALKIKSIVTVKVPLRANTVKARGSLSLEQEEEVRAKEKVSHSETHTHSNDNI